MRNEITVLTYPVMGNNLIQTKDHDNVSPAQWTSVPTMMYRLRTRLAETLMSTGDQSSTGIFTAYQTDFAAVVECPCCGFRRYCSILWRCLIDRLCRILVCAVVIVIGVSPKMLIQRCGVGAHVTWRPTASVNTRRCFSEQSKLHTCVFRLPTPALCTLAIPCW